MSRVRLGETKTENPLRLGQTETDKRWNAVSSVQWPAVESRELLNAVEIGI